MRRLIIDTNLLCLLVVGRLGEVYISKHKRLQAYAVEDYELLVSVISGFTELVTTPHILAETSNLLRQTTDPLAGYASRSLGELVNGMDEQPVPVTSIVAHPEYVRLGITDVGIIELLSTGCYLLSADLDLYLASSSAGYAAFNFNHLRDGAVEL